MNGNQLLPQSVRIVAAEETAEEMHHEPPPEMMIATQIADVGPVLTRFMRDRFTPFDFSGIRLRFADQTFEGSMTLDVGGREVRVLNLGPAHTHGDSIVHVPDAGVVYTGDLLFIGCTPIVWGSPISNWIKACDTIIGLDASAIVPGHGPVTDADGVRAVQSYFRFVTEQADAAHAKGLDFKAAAFGIDLGEYSTWLDSERVVVNIYQRYREIDPGQPPVSQMALMGLMAKWDADRNR